MKIRSMQRKSVSILIFPSTDLTSEIFRFPVEVAMLHQVVQGDETISTLTLTIEWPQPSVTPHVHLQTAASDKAETTLITTVASSVYVTFREVEL